MILVSGLALVLVWALVVAAYRVADAHRPTAESVSAYAHSLDLAALTPEQRRAALERLVKQLNSLDFESRRAVRLGRGWEGVLGEMTDAERLWFVQETLPRGVQQMLDAFEALPEDKRRRAIEDSLRRLREARARFPSATPSGPVTPPEVSEEMQRQIVGIGLKAFYTQSSAQTKAELAPVLEEMQRLMESGRLIYERRRRE